MRSDFWIWLFLSLAPLYGFSQKPPELTSSEIFQKIEKLGTLANVLYVAAHPDDENTSMISYFSNEKHFETTYLSLTRGDGGQNLIGPEIGPLLGVIRTQELLAARKIDRGSQMFSRAVDFGYSKHPSEALDMWNKEAVLYDVVWAIRKTRPDIIVNRFDHRSPGTTHGHHTGSAMLSFEAFDLAADPEVFPEQLEWVEPWQPKRLFFNTSWWFYGSQERFEQAEKAGMNTVDVGGYYPLLGKSNNEISALSRSQHRCQGFGQLGSRGEELSYLEFLKGEKPEGEDPTEGINTTWSRVKGGESILKAYEKIKRDFDFKNPAASTTALADLYRMIEKMPDHAFKEQKLEECLGLIQACSGLFLEVRLHSHRLVPGQTVRGRWEMINRGGGSVRAKAVEILPVGSSVDVDQTLEKNKGLSGDITFVLPDNAPYSNPYWLNHPGETGLYHVDSAAWIGLPETPSYLKARFFIEVEGLPLEIERDLVNVINRPERGEIYRPVEIIPAYTVSIQNPILFFRKGETKQLTVSVKNHSGIWNRDTLKLNLPEGFSVSPAYYLPEEEGSSDFTFTLTGPQGNMKQSMMAEIHTTDGRVYDQTLIEIDYEHIPLQTVLQPASTTLVSLQIYSAAERVGYLQGAGDEIPRFLEEIGIKTESLDLKSVIHQNLEQYDAIVLGVRALNTIDDIGRGMPYLLDYAKNGGTLVLQYNTNQSLKTNNFSPYPLQISRGRVSDEHSPVRIRNPDHPVMSKPNKVTEADFEDWVQERGLYFPGNWGEEFETVVAFQDPDEPFLESGLLVAPYGEGYYVYTGLSFFRQLPAGVTGAFKLFVNILSLDQTNQ